MGYKLGDHMTLKNLGMINSENYNSITSHLNQNKNRLTLDVSTYATNRQRYWLQDEWDLKNRKFIPGIKDERLWNYCKHWMPDADLGLVVYGNVGITEHRDDSYADYRSVGINLGELESWSYDCRYPEFRWTAHRNPRERIYHKIQNGEVFEFNCKNPHAAIRPHEDRWAIFLWKVSQKFKAQYKEYKSKQLKI